MAIDENYIPNNNLPIMVDNRIVSNDMNRREKPHIAIVTVKVDIWAVNADGTLDQYVMGDSTLERYGISRKGQFVVKGHDEADCINKIIQTMERIQDGQT